MFHPKTLPLISGCSAQKEKLEESQKFLEHLFKWKKEPHTQLLHDILKHELPLDAFALFQFDGQLLLQNVSSENIQLEQSHSIIKKSLRGIPTVLFHFEQDHSWIFFPEKEEYASTLIFPFKEQQLILLLFSKKEGSFSSRHSSYLQSLFPLLYS